MRFGARRTGLLSAGILALAVAGCKASAVDVTDVASCTTGTECPSGVCLDGRCEPVGADADADATDVGEAEAEVEAEAEIEAETETVSDADADGSMWTDTDGDTIPDPVEGWSDPDGDTTPNAEDRDSDGDGIGDDREAGDADVRTVPRDTDRDGTADFLDEDSDGDTIPDTEEIAGNPALPPDGDGDTVPDHRDTDSDGDSISDRDERGRDTDGDTIPDRRDTDSDRDGIPDAQEAGDADLSTFPIDTDEDGTPDYLDPDSDADGLSDRMEFESGTDPTRGDSDGDGVNDLVEVAAGTDPLDAADNPRARGNFVFEVPYEEDPIPLQDTLVFATALQKADVGAMPQNDGKMIRISLPMMTEDRRKDLVKVLKKMGEEFRVGVRNDRQETLNKVKKSFQAKEITEDDLRGLETRIQKTTDSFTKQIDDSVAAKEKEILTI